MNEIKEFNYKMNKEIKSESKSNGKELLNKLPSCLDKEKDDEISADILGEINEWEN